MRLHLRVLAALFALFALSLPSVQEVWASTCAPGTLAESTRAPFGGADGLEMDCPTDMDVTHSDGLQEGQDQPHSQCPFGPMAASGGCALAPLLLPAQASVFIAPSPEDVMLPASPRPMRDLLSVVPFFRPPRA